MVMMMMMMMDHSMFLYYCVIVAMLIDHHFHLLEMERKMTFLIFGDEWNWYWILTIVYEQLLLMMVIRGCSIMNTRISTN